MGSPEGNWFPWLARQIRNVGVEVAVPKLPTPEGQSFENWRTALKDQYGQLGFDTILVGHSLGATFALRLLEEFKDGQSIVGTFLVSTVAGALGNEEYDKLNASFVDEPFRWDLIKQTAGPVKVYQGDNDPYVPVSMAEEVAKNLGVKLDLIKDGGHLNSESGFDTFPQLWQDLKPRLDQKTATP